MLFDRIKVMMGDVHVTPLHIQLLINYLEATIKKKKLFAGYDVAYCQTRGAIATKSFMEEDGFSSHCDKES